MFPLGRAKLSGVFENFFVLQKTPSLIWTKGAEMHTHFRAFFKKFFEKIYPFTCSHWEVPNYWVFLKNFLSGKKPSHLFGIAKPNDTLFHRKIRKYFFGCRCFILLPSKSLFTYSHWEGANSNPVSKNILLFAKPLHLFGIRRLKRNLFFKKTEKIF